MKPQGHAEREALRARDDYLQNRWEQGGKKKRARSRWLSRIINRARRRDGKFIATNSESLPK
jgi:hypothetical protein